MQYYKIHLNKIIVGIASATLFYYCCPIRKTDDLPDKVVLQANALVGSADLSLELWGVPFDEAMTLEEYSIGSRQSFWGIVQQSHIGIPPSLHKELLNNKSPAYQLLSKLQPAQKITFIKKNNNLNYIIIDKDGDDVFVGEKVCRPLSVSQSSQQEYTRYSISIQKSLSYDLSRYKIPAPIQKQIIECLASRLNLSKHIYKGNQLQFLYGKNQKGDWQLYKFSFDNGKKQIRGYYYPFEGEIFVDETGLAFKKGLLEKPVEPSYISSYFTKARKHPVLGVVRAHKGVDFAAPKGTPVRASSDGKIIFMGVKGGYGNLIEIDHGQGIKTRYGHLDSFAKGLKVGSQVEQSQIIGAVGMTGLATGPHLHYELIVKGEAIDPLKPHHYLCRKVPAHENIAFQKARSRYDELERTTPLQIKMI